MPHHRLQHLCSGRCKRVRRFTSQTLFERFSRWQGGPLFANESPQASTITLALQRPRQQRDMNTSPCFVPGAEGSCLYILFNALFGAPEKSEFPIVNRAGPIGRQVRDPSFAEE